MNIEEIEKLSGRNIWREKLPFELLRTLIAEVIDSVQWDGGRSLFWLSIPDANFEFLLSRLKIKTAENNAYVPPITLLKYSGDFHQADPTSPLPLILAVADGRKSAFLFAQPAEEPSLSRERNFLYETAFSLSPLAAKRCLRAFAAYLSDPKLKKEWLSAINSSIPSKSRPGDWQLFGLDIARGSARHLRKSLSTLAWSRFGFQLEEKLGDLLESEETLQAFSDLLKTRLPYDYLEISFLENSFPDQPEPSNWVRNDTGLGGKLLSILLKEHFQRGLPRRRQPLIVHLEKSDPIIENPELLRVMELHRGILVPILHGDRAQGVMKLFFQNPYQFNQEQVKWLITSASILLRALKRAWRYQAVQKMATIDGLTGLYNHRYFMEQLHKEFTRARRYRNWLSLILIDIDHFKVYNDNNGHLAGDRVLMKVAETIRNSVREIDLVARWGGEEFALLLPEVNEKNGLFVAEKIRREVEAQRFKNERLQPGGRLTISLGVAENSSNLKNYREMFNLADAALYKAKHNGRNQCASAK